MDEWYEEENILMIMLVAIIYNTTNILKMAAMYGW